MKFHKDLQGEQKSKIDRQKVAIEKWKEAKGIGTFLHCPRFGKLYEGVEIVKRIVNKRPFAKIRIVVPSDIIYQQWNQHLSRNLGIIDNYNIEVITNHRMATEVKTDVVYDLVIIDEVHRFVSSETLYEGLPHLVAHSKFRLGLLGVISDTVRSKIEEFAPIVDIIDEVEAIKNKWISDYTEYNVPLELSDEDKLKYAKYSLSMRELISQFSKLQNQIIYDDKPLFESELDVILACYTGFTYKKKYIASHKVRELVAARNDWSFDMDFSDPHNKEIDNKWNPMVLYDKCKSFKVIMDNRNEILINNQIKLDLIITILKKNTVKTIIFNESIEFVDKVTQALNDVGVKSISYHSKLESMPLIDPQTGEFYVYMTGAKAGEPKMFSKKSIKEYAILGIRESYFNCLVTVRALDEGLTIDNIEQVITTAGSTNPIQYSQRLARGNTLNPYNPDKVTKVINLYFDDFYLPDGSKVNSRDRAKLLKRQQFSKDVKNVKIIDEIFA